MSLKDLSLDPYYLAELFRQPLIPRFNTTNSSQGTGEAREIIWGNNRQKILFLIFNKKETFLSEPLFIFFKQILKACSLDMNDIALMNRAHIQENELKNFITQLAPEKIVLFGPAIPEIFPENHLKNEVWTTGDVHYLYTDTLEQLFENKQLKAGFWKGLQQLFELKK